MAKDALSTTGLAPVLARLEAAGIPADTSARRVAEYSYDASNYRVPPIAVVFPRSPEDVVAAVAACRHTGTPLVSRGGGTSMAGNAVGPGIVLDFSWHMNRIISIDEDAGTANVEAGVILAHLSRQTESTTGGRLTFTPDPSSKNRATVGGSIGNDACDNHSVRYGRTSDHVVGHVPCTAFEKKSHRRRPSASSRAARRPASPVTVMSAN